MASQVLLSSKRKAIADSNRMMFLWVAGMSAVVGICAVVAIFLAQQIAFRANVIKVMSSTASTLEKNNKAVGDLSSNILVLETNDALNSAKASPDEKALQVILDALPADRNTLALGSSLQQSLLTGIDGLSVDSIVIDSDTSGGNSTTTASSSNTIPIQMKVSLTTASGVKDLFVRLEHSIRTIDIDNVVLQTNGSGYDVTISAHAYFEPPTTVTLTNKVVKP